MNKILKYENKYNDDWNTRNMGNKIKKMIRKSRIILIGILVLVFITLIIATPNFLEKKIIKIEDKCGKFVNLISHTIGDESTCKSRCRAQCIGLGDKYDKVEFEKSNVGCNLCTCFCK